MDCIDLPQEARWTEDELRKIIDEIQDNEGSSSWTRTPAYESWKSFLQSCLSECSAETQEIHDPVNGINSPRVAEALVRNGVPPERIVGTFKLLFT